MDMSDFILPDFGEECIPLTSVQVTVIIIIILILGTHLMCGARIFGGALPTTDGDGTIIHGHWVSIPQ